jgi:DNA (cytosine-5)-methyltransferase 1
MGMNFGSVCSGIEAASVAWHPLGYRAAWLAEIEAFPAAVLAHHYPEVPNLGDMTKIATEVLSGTVAAPDVLVGGTPCQAFSVAGMRAGLQDARGKLTIEFVRLADAIDHVRVARGEQPAITVWENVPGVLSDRGNAFGCFLGALAGEDCELQPSGKRWTDAGCVYGPKRAIAWRVLDAQYFGLAQRRRRVFVVASARAGFDPAAVLFEFEGLRRDTPPSRSTGQDFAADTLRGAEDGCFDSGRAASGRPAAQAFGGGKNCNPTDVSTALTAHPGGRYDLEIETFVVHGTQDPCVMHDQAFTLGRNNGGENVLAFSCKDYGADAGYIAPTLRAMGHSGSHANAGGQVAVCVTGDIAHTLKAEGFDGSEDGTGRGQPIVAATLEATAGRSRGAGTPIGLLAATQSAVRRLNPRECERLQGFPDSYTLVQYRNKEAADGPRYKALGNSMAVPVMRWIGERIAVAASALKEQP